MKKSSSFGGKQIAITAILLAICLVSQVFKNLSIFITGPIINLCLVLAVMLVNLPCGIVLSIITPVTAYFIVASPVMIAVPGIMLGNIVLVVLSHFLLKKEVLKPKGLVSIKSYCMAFLCALGKGLFMGLTISLWLLPSFIPQDSPLRGKMSVFQTTFSVFQFVTTCIGFVYFFIVMAALKKYMEFNE